jgi:hypothetical protein
MLPSSLLLLAPSLPSHCRIMDEINDRDHVDRSMPAALPVINTTYSTRGCSCWHKILPFSFVVGDVSIQVRRVRNGYDVTI